MNSTENKNGFIYLIRPSSFRNNNLQIYKLGKSYNYISRFNTYEKFSELYVIYFVNNVDQVEKILIEIFKTKFIQEVMIGKEYFNGNIFNMIENTEKLLITFEYIINKVNLYNDLLNNKLNRFIIYNDSKINKSVYDFIKEKMNKQYIDIFNVSEYNDFYYKNIMKNNIKEEIKEEEIKEEEVKEEVKEEEIKEEEVKEEKDKIKEINVYKNTNLNKQDYQPVVYILHICHHCIDYRTPHRKDMIKHFQRKNKCILNNKISYEEAEKLSLYKKFYFYFDYTKLFKNEIIKIITFFYEKNNNIYENYNDIIKNYNISIQNKKNDGIYYPEEAKDIDEFDLLYFNFEKGKYECKSCNSEYTSKQNMKKHLANIKNCEKKTKLHDLIELNIKRAIQYNKM